MKIAFLPIDNRPVCYTLPKIISQIDESVEFFIPPRVYLGDLEKSADVDELFNWLENLPKCDRIILTLDTVAYGGLIPSRRCESDFERIKNRIFKLKNILMQKNAKIYAFSSIMRISNNNINQEEKEYWNLWGKKIFKYSYELDKNGFAQTDVPNEILKDYLSTRKRNFEINKIYLEWQKEGLFDTLVFSKDDCAQYGLNVKEAKELENLGGFVKTGADEIPLSLLSRAINKEIKICPIFLEPDFRNLISNYEDISIEKSVISQIELAGCKVCDETEADILLYVNNFKNNQGEIVMGVETEEFNKKFNPADKPYMIADVRFANGADNSLVEEFFRCGCRKDLDKNFYGYSAWNTSANTLGSLICGAKFKFCAEKYNSGAFLKLQITRFLDDWAYQANVRQKLTNLDIQALKNYISPYEKKIEKFLNSKFSAKYYFPWNRLFEVDIELD